jgi:hypothetical protein
MDIPEQDDEILHVVNGLAAKSVLEEMPIAFISLVEVGCISDANSFSDATDVFTLFLYQEMDVVAHQTIGVDGAERWKALPLFVESLYQSSEYQYHLAIIYRILEDVLTINSPEHYMINTRAAFSSYFSSHFDLSINYLGKGTKNFPYFQIFCEENDLGGISSDHF